MCGIWAFVQFLQTKDKENITKYFKDFWNSKNRGPDHSNFELFNNVFVGFHRLAIMDRSIQSNQPYIFKNNNETIVFICNGEIYNYKELNKKYDLDIGSSDCKVIPALYKSLIKKLFIYV